jgi:hypothetical protein
MSQNEQTTKGMLGKGYVVELPNGYDWDYILAETGLTKSRISELMRYFSRLPLDIQLDVLKSQLDDYNEHKQQWQQAYARRATEARYVQFLIAINKQHKFEHQQERKSSGLDNEKELAKLTQQRLQRLQQAKGKGDRKFQALKQRRFVLRQLRQQGASWRDIQLYLAKFHRVKVSHSYIQRVFEMFFDNKGQEIL